MLDLGAPLSIPNSNNEPAMKATLETMHDVVRKLGERWCVVESEIAHERSSRRPGAGAQVVL